MRRKAEKERRYEMEGLFEALLHLLFEFVLEITFEIAGEIPGEVFHNLDNFSAKLQIPLTFSISD